MMMRGMQMLQAVSMNVVEGTGHAACILLHGWYVKRFFVAS